MSPSIGRDQQRQGAQERGLAAAVAAGQRQQLAARQGEGEIAEYRPAAAAAGQVLDLEVGHRDGRSIVRVYSETCGLPRL
jgi:hypothetical protein